MKDHIFETREGWYAVVDGYSYGMWRTKAEAQLGMKVEQERARNRNALAAGSDVKAATALRKQS